MQIPGLRAVYQTRALRTILIFTAAAATMHAQHSPAFVDIVNPAGKLLRAHARVLTDATGDYVQLGNGFRLYPGADGRLGTADDIVQGFGRFPQSDLTGANADPLNWRLLDIIGDHAILTISVIIDGAAFNLANESDAWDASNLRAWLNSTGGTDETGDTQGFLNRAFTSAEKSKLVPTDVPMDGTGSYIAYNTLLKSDWWHLHNTSGTSTRDLVWALSGEEVFQYFGKSTIATRQELGHDPANYTNAYFVPSPWARATGVKINEGHNGPSFVGYGDAWTRSPGAPFDGTNYYGVFLGSTGSLNVGRPVTHAYGTLPVIAVRLSGKQPGRKP